MEDYSIIDAIVNIKRLTIDEIKRAKSYIVAYLDKISIGEVIK